MKRFEKSTLPRIRPRGGISTSLTSEVTILPNAAPMMSPTARSTTLPRIAKSRNSFSMSPPWTAFIEPVPARHRASLAEQLQELVERRDLGPAIGRRSRLGGEPLLEIGKALIDRAVGADEAGDLLHLGDPAI